MTTTKSRLQRASKAAPCAVCAGTSKCSVTADGLILCGRSAGPLPGFDHLGACKDPTWHQYRAADSARVPASAPSRAPDLADLAEQFGRALTPEKTQELTERLGLPRGAALLVPGLGYDWTQGCWTLPERDAQGRVVGIATRFADGTKKAVAGSSRGLSIPLGWADADGPELVVEGFSDALALARCGLKAVGRPSARGGADLLAALFADADPGRDIVVLVENDQKPDGTWPGREGAEAVAAELGRRLKRRVLLAAPPEQYKDARDWVVDRLQGAPEGADARVVGRDIAAALARVCSEAKAKPPQPRADRFPLPVPFGTLGGESGGTPWLWDGYLMRGGVTLLSAHPKAGKTTLLSHLIRDLGRGGEFCGRALKPGRVVIVSEESAEMWKERRDLLGFGDHARVLSRPFFGPPDRETWLAFLAHLHTHFRAEPCDLVIFDTLSDLWPVEDENRAGEVKNAILPLKHLADGRAVLGVHHLRKSGGKGGSGSRGSNSLTGTVDILMELSEPEASTDPTGTTRLIWAKGRPQGIPLDWAVQLDPATQRYAGRDAGEGAKARAEQKAARDAHEVRLHLGAAISQAGPAGATYAALRDAVPAEWQTNDKRLRQALKAGSEAGDWVKIDRGTKAGGPIYLIAGPDGVTPEDTPMPPGELFPDQRGLPD